MTTQPTEPTNSAPDVLPALEPLTFKAPPPAAPGMPNPIPRGIAWNEPITAQPASQETAQ